MENLINTNPTQEKDFTEREPTNEERWVNDVNEEFGEEEPLVNDDPENIPLEDDKDIEEEPPLNDEELAGEIPVEEDTEFEEDDLFKIDDDEDLEDSADDIEYK